MAHNITLAAPAAASPAMALDALEFLAFKLGREEYGIDIQKVQELRGYEEPTRIANAPELEERMVILIDIDKLMSGADMGLIERLAA